jgi:AraC family transcriptional regulator of adaptative response / DNA-3-methyladenine glycosylase II
VIARAVRLGRFDGRFFIAITTTKIYCRPICPSPTANYEHVRYFPTAAAAEAAGYRPCLRCRPEASPGTPAWSGTSGVVSRALRLINEGALDCEDVESFAERHGVTGRHLRRLFLEHLGSTPHQIALTRRLHFAKKLLDETALPMHEVAYASGFGSLRSFNDKIQRTYSRSPTRLRSMARHQAVTDPECYRFRLAYRPPFDWCSLLGFLEECAVPGVEMVRDGQYRRTIAIGHQVGVINISRPRSNDEVALEVRFPESRALLFIVERVRRMLDLAADPAVLEEHLSLDPLLGTRMKDNPGVRIPGAWDSFEVAVLAILGQRDAPRCAARMAARLAAMFGRVVQDSAGLERAFPTAPQLAAVAIEQAGIGPEAALAIRTLATSVSSGTTSLNSCIDVYATARELAAIRGIDRLTVEYILMRGLGEPDAFPFDHSLVQSGDLGPEHWRPWRAYAAMLLWRANGVRNRS